MDDPVQRSAGGDPGTARARRRLEEASGARGPGKRAFAVDGHELVVLLLATAAALFGIVERRVVYFDEVINLSRALRDVPVFNYASRPVFYSLNRLALEWLGEDSLSLSLLACLLYVVTAWLLFRLGRRLAGAATGWLAALGFCGSQIVLVHGIRGMPHLPAGFFLTLSLVCAAAAWRGGRSAGLLAGVAAAAALGSHPTLMAFFASLALVAGVEIAIALRRVGDRGPRALLRMPEVWLLAGLAIGAVLLLAGQMLTNPTYLDQLRVMVHRVQVEERYAASARGATFYAWRLLRDPVLAVLAAAAAGGVVTAIFLGRGRQALADLWHDRPAVRLLALSLLSLAVLALARWKFERVLVAFVPLLAITAAVLAAGSWRWVGSGEGRRRLAAGLVAVVAVAAAAGSWRASRRVTDWPAGTTDPFERTVEVVRSLSEEGAAVGYIGDAAGRRPTAHLTRVGGRTSMRLNPFLHRRRKGLEESAIERDVRLLWVRRPPEGGETELLEGWRARFRYYRPRRVHTHRELFDLWLLVPQTSFDWRFAELAPGTRVAVWGDERDAGVTPATWAREALAAQGLDSVSLSLDPPAASRLELLQAEGIDHVLLLPGDRPATRRKGRQARRSLVEQGAERLGREAGTGVELWRLDAGLD